MQVSDRTEQYFKIHDFATKESRDLRDPTKLHAHLFKYLNDSETLEDDLKQFN